MSLSRRRFLTAPVLALGAGVCMGAGVVAQAKSSTNGPLRFALLRLQGSDGSAADAQRRGNAWENAVAENGPDLARITVHGFVPASVFGPGRVLVQSLFGDGDQPAHDLYRYFAEPHLANSKPIGFDALAGAFTGFRVSLTHAEGSAAQVGEFRVPRLRPGFYVLIADDVMLPAAYAFSGERARPLTGPLGIVPNHLAFSVAESV
jgi:hypothetical protein